jgi:predicted TIM-barrel fold metal-dependent hydrolase
VLRRIEARNHSKPWDYAEGGEFIDTVPISESDRRKIAYENARALYKL